MTKVGTYLNRWELTWRYLRNPLATAKFRFRRGPALKNASTQVLLGLNSDGFAMTTADDLFESPSIMKDLRDEVGRRKAALDPSKTGGKTDAKSKIDLMGDREFQTLDRDSPLLAPAYDPQIRGLASRYLGMEPKLSFVQVWWTFPAKEDPQFSQLWHTDPDDRTIFKLFVYLSDVDFESGPLSYALGTHSKGALGLQPESEADAWGARRSNDEQMELVVPRDRWRIATGNEGTVVVADTRGYHKGGYAVSKERLVYTCTYVSPSA